LGAHSRSNLGEAGGLIERLSAQERHAFDVWVRRQQVR
jgi:hypothetical protein